MPELHAPPPPLPAHLDWKVRYSSDQDDLVKDFFTPALASAKRYDRAVGYFRVSALAEIGQSLEPFFRPNNKMRLVASCEFAEKDIRAIEAGLKLRDVQDEALARATDRVVAGFDQRPDFNDPVGLLTGLLVEGLLDIWIAIGRLDGGPALYHEKIGVIEDHYGNFLTFEGSPNETGAALTRNIESFPMHRSWVGGEKAHADAAKEAVDGLFEDPPKRNVEIRRFPDALAAGLIKKAEPRVPETYHRRNVKRRAEDKRFEPHPVPKEQVPMIPAGISLHDYQAEAVRGWLGANGRGRFEMATGTGKTITALAAAVQVVEQCEANGESLWIVVLVPDDPLVTQWAEEAKGFGFRPVASGTHEWRRKLEGQLLQLRTGLKSSSLLICTFDSALAKQGHLINQIKEHQGNDQTARVMLVADEAHGLGAPTRQKLLVSRFDYRLALTATFNRHFDDEGTELLNQFFEGHRTRVSIDQAINEYRTLVQYRYHPVVVELTEEEADQYDQLSVEIAQLYGMAQGGWGNFEDRAKFKLLERSNILKHAAGKVPAFRRVVSELEERKYMLVYTAEGTGPVQADIRQDDELLAVLKALQVDARQFNGDQSRAARVFLQGELDQGRCDCLVAMKCLDEGIDIPEARIGLFVSSTTNPRQYVQRRGRILRKPKSAASTKDSADLYDFIVKPPRVEGDSDRFNMERKLVARELMRALELARSALNKNRAEAELEDLITYYRLEDLRPESQDD
jgi:superfamily II DNA or RNA helicase